MLLTRKHSVTTLVSLVGFIAVLLMNSVQAHPGHAPTQVHSHLGSPMMWLMLGVAALGLIAAALSGRKLWRQGRDAKVAQKYR